MDIFIRLSTVLTTRLSLGAHGNSIQIISLNGKKRGNGSISRFYSGNVQKRYVNSYALA
jgi:hypothetical protein